MTVQLLMTYRVRAAVVCTPLLVLLAVVTVNFVVRSASGKRVDLAKASPVELVAVAESICTGCKGEQDDAKKQSRILVSLPVTGRMFKKKGVTVELCEYCDGEALALAKRPTKPNP